VKYSEHTDHPSHRYEFYRLWKSSSAPHQAGKNLRRESKELFSLFKVYQINIPPNTFFQKTLFETPPHNCQLILNIFSIFSLIN
jgi:hypothetical protein